MRNEGKKGIRRQANHLFRDGKKKRNFNQTIDYFSICGIILLKESPANKWTFKKR